MRISGKNITTIVSDFDGTILKKGALEPPEEFFEIIVASSIDLGKDGYDTYYGYGLADTKKYLEYYLFFYLLLKYKDYLFSIVIYCK